MGSLTECFSNLSDYLLAEQKNPKPKKSPAELVRTSWLRPLLPSGIRSGPGIVIDIKDRQVGPFDFIGATDNFPAFSEGTASTYLADGVVWALQVRNWAESDLSQFGALAGQLKTLQRKNKEPMAALAVSFAPLPLPELSQFLKSSAGKAVDGILCIGHHVILRNAKGLYGDAARIPFVTESPGPEALKAFTFFLLQLSQAALHLPFGLADYQHL